MCKKQCKTKNVGLHKTLSFTLALHPNSNFLSHTHSLDSPLQKSLKNTKKKQKIHTQNQTQKNLSKIHCLKNSQNPIKPNLARTSVGPNANTASEQVRTP
jgi:hypothetical protein